MGGRGDRVYTKIFPYKTIRKEQKEAIDFALKTLINDDKKFVIIEAGTGVGKSAIGLTVARYVDNHLRNKNDEEYIQGSPLKHLFLIPTNACSV